MSFASSKYSHEQINQGNYSSWNIKNMTDEGPI